MRDFSEAEWELARLQLEHIPNGVDILRQYLEIPEQVQQVQGRHGDNWTLQDAIEVLLAPKKPARLRNNYGGKKAAGPPKRKELEEMEPVKPNISKDELEKRAQDRLQEYLGAFTETSPNDRARLWELASADVMLDVLQEMSNDAALGADGALLSRVGYTIKLYSDRTRLLEKHLNIDRRTRDQEAEKMSEAEAALEVMDEAGKWVEEHGVKVVHTHCQPQGVIGTSDILFGIIAWDFPEVGFTVVVDKCPRCGQMFHVTHTPTEKDKEDAHEPEWVRVEEGEYSVKEEQLRSEQVLKELDEEDE